MKPVDFFLIIGIAAVLVLAVYLSRRRKKTSSCCGDCSACVKAVRAADRNRAHYPYEAAATISGMTCQNCAVTVENALNALDGVWAAVRVDTKTARILCKNPPSEEEIKKAVHSVGYGVDSFEVKRAV